MAADEHGMMLPGWLAERRDGTYADGLRFDQLRFLQCKLILKPDRFTSTRVFKEFARLVQRAAQATGVGFTRAPKLEERPRVREVLFLDTGDFHLYNNAFIVRRRIAYEDGFPVGDPEIVFKYRTPDMMMAQAMDVRPHISGSYRVKFKLEIMPLKERIGGVRRLLSHNVEFGLSQAPEADRLAMASLDHMSLPELQKLFPPLQTITCEGSDDVALVNQCIVEELMQDICTLDFGRRTEATANLALWRARGGPPFLRRRVRLPDTLQRPGRFRPQGIVCLRAFLHRAAADRRRLAVAHHDQDRGGLPPERQPTTGPRMSDQASTAPPRPSLGRIFRVFLVMGATSLGGGVVGYLRTGLVVRERWLDDTSFVELLSISQTLPGLNATNMSILVGDRLRGARGAILATLGMCLPGAALMTGAAFAYGVGGDDPWSKAFLQRHRRRRPGIDRRGHGAARLAGAEVGCRLCLRPGHRRRCRGLRHPGPLCPARGRRGRHLVAPASSPGAARQGHEMKQLGDIAGVFAYLSLLTVGGGMAAFPELKTLTVDTYHWVTFPELLHFYSLGQLAPGPNMMMVASIGAVAAQAGATGVTAGLTGASVALVAFFLPTGILTFAIGRLWTHLATWRWRPAIQTGLGSVSVGLVLAGAIIMGRGAVTNALYAAIALVVFFLLLKTKINPAYRSWRQAWSASSRTGWPELFAAQLCWTFASAIRHSGRRLGCRCAGRPRHADRRDLVGLYQAALVPVAAQHEVVDAQDALTLRHAAGIAALETHRLVPAVLAPTLALAVAIGADEAVDRVAMLEPLRLPLTVRLPGMARALPHHLVLRLRMPIPHAAACLGIEQPGALVAGRGPADLQRIGFARGQSGLDGTSAISCAKAGPAIRTKEQKRGMSLMDGPRNIRAPQHPWSCWRNAMPR